MGATAIYPGVVHQLQVCVGGPGRGGHGHAGPGPQPELVREPHRQLHPHRCQPMAGPEVIVSQPLVPGHMQAAGHLPPPFLTPRAAGPDGPADGLVSTVADITGLVQIPVTGPLPRPVTPVVLSVWEVCGAL
jgi:hypothetical protein